MWQIPKEIQNAQENVLKSSNCMMKNFIGLSTKKMWKNIHTKGHTGQGKSLLSWKYRQQTRTREERVQKVQKDKHKIQKKYYTIVLERFTTGLPILWSILAMIYQILGHFSVVFKDRWRWHFFTFNDEDFFIYEIDSRPIKASMKMHQLVSTYDQNALTQLLMCTWL